VLDSGVCFVISGLQFGGGCVDFGGLAEERLLAKGPQTRWWKRMNIRATRIPLSVKHRHNGGRLAELGHGL
jgi:hypothetical protein